jgi:C4-dicarboxylate transporter DctM subunit
MCIGFITPPYGFNLFVVSSVTGARFVDVVRNITPFLIAMIIANVLIALIPQLSLWILRFR